MALSSLVVIHERLGTWARQLRRRVTGVGAPRFVESRSSRSLEQAINGSIAPIILFDLANRPQEILNDLVVAVHAAPHGLFLVLDPNNHPGVAPLAREIGATYVISGWAAPPDVATLIQYWLPLAKARADRDGWSIPPEREPEPWERPDVFPTTITAPFSPEDIES